MQPIEIQSTPAINGGTMWRTALVWWRISGNECFKHQLGHLHEEGRGGTHDGNKTNKSWEKVWTINFNIRLGKGHWVWAEVWGVRGTWYDNLTRG